MAISSIIENVADTDYSITSKRVHATLELSMALGSATFQVTVVHSPSTAVELHRSGWSKTFPIPTPTEEEEIFTLPGESAARRVRWSTSCTTVDGVEVCTLTLALDDEASAAFDEPWELRVSGLPESAGTRLLAGDHAEIVAIEADPIIDLQPPAQVHFEGETADLRAVVQRNTYPAPTTSCDGMSLNWSQLAADEFSAPVTMTASPTPATSPALLPACALEASVALPGVTSVRTTHYQIDATVGAFDNHEIASVEIQPRVRNTLLIVDRSGSMSGDRWDNAHRGTHLALDFLIALRQGVTDDKVGVLVFEDTSCTFRTSSMPDPLIEIVFPTPGSLSDLSSASTNTLELGSPGTCTPLGDAIVQGLVRLSNATSSADNDLYSVILLTDGYENSGTVKIDRDTNGTAPLLETALSSSTTLSKFKFAGPIRNTYFYTVGVGPDGGVQESVLASLTNTTAATPGGYYHLERDASDLKAVFSAMATDFLGAQQQDIASTPLRDDPDNPAVNQAAYFVVPDGEQKVVVALVHGDGQHLDLKYRLQEAMIDTFQTLPPSAKVFNETRDGHSVLAVSLENLFPTSASPGTEWRVQNLTAGGAAQPFEIDSALAVRDLHVRSTVSFHRNTYYTGDPMEISVRITAGGTPIRKARVTVELERPEISLGTFLAKNAGGFDPVQDQRDKLSLKAQLLRFALAKHGLKVLPTVRPPKIFSDGTNQLFPEDLGPDSRGVFENKLAQTPVEGTYSFRIRVEGITPAGSRFRDILSVAQFVGVRPDPFTSTVEVDCDVPGPRKFEAAEISVVPYDRNGELLGPFRSSHVRFHTTEGVWTGPVEASLDGRYKRVLVFKREQNPIVTLTVNGVEFPPIKLDAMICHVLRARRDRDTQSPETS